MRTNANTYISVAQVTILLFYAVLCWLMLTGSAVASDSLQAPANTKSHFKAQGKLKLDCKAYIISHKPSYRHRARKVTVECHDLSNDRHQIYKSKSGKLTLEFKLDTRYLVYISKEGYETKMLAFSTKGADLTTLYEFNFDLLLEKSGKATYDEYTPAIYIVYNRLHRLFLYKRFLYRAFWTANSW